MSIISIGRDFLTALGSRCVPAAPKKMKEIFELIAALSTNLSLTQLTLLPPDQICNSTYCQPYNSYNFSLKNLLMDQLIIPILKFFFILATYLVNIVLRV